jgi:hypothetical protein
VSEAEEIDALPVLAEDVTAVPVAARGQAALQRPASAGMIPAVQAAAAAAGGFVAGAAVVGLVHRRHRRAAALSSRRRPVLSRRSRPAGRAGTVPGELLQIVGSRSLLLDVHLLGGSSADR